MAHHCHAAGCKTPCKPELLMCLTHWRKVPKKLQLNVLRAYRNGQCDDKEPSIEWCIAADAAVEAVANKEGALPPRLTFRSAFHPTEQETADFMRRVMRIGNQQLELLSGGEL